MAAKAAGGRSGSCQLGGNDRTDLSPSKALDTLKAPRRKIFVTASRRRLSVLPFPWLWEDAWGSHRQSFNPDCSTGGAGDLGQGKAKELLLHSALGAHRQNALG